MKHVLGTIHKPAKSDLNHGSLTAQACACSSVSDLEDRGYLDESRDNADPYLEGGRFLYNPHH